MDFKLNIFIAKLSIIYMYLARNKIQTRDKIKQEINLSKR